MLPILKEILPTTVVETVIDCPRSVFRRLGLSGDEPMDYSGDGLLAPRG